jgi:hypothetical protein
MKKLIIVLLAVFLAIPLVVQAVPAITGWYSFPADGGNKSQMPVIIGLPALRYVNNYVLVANTAKSITVPTGANYVLISGTSLPIYMNFQGTAVVPSTDITDGSGSFPNLGVPIALVGTTAISIISPYAGVAGVAFGK